MMIAVQTYLKVKSLTIVKIKMSRSKCQAPAKRSQHVNATLLGATCCVCLVTVLQHVGSCWLKFDQFQT